MLSYVYVHRDPETHEVRYVGAGSGGRAWTCNYSPKNSASGRRGNRSKNHHSWLLGLFDVGYTMGDIVHIVAQGLTRSEALTLEKVEIKKHNSPNLFNLPYGQHSLVLSEEDVIRAKELRANGAAYERIGNQLNVSAMTVYRALTGQTEGYMV